MFDVIISANANNQPGCSRQFCELPQHDNLNKIIGRSLEFFATQKIGMTGYKSYSDLFRVFIDPRVEPEGDRNESVPEGDRKFYCLDYFVLPLR